MALQFIAEEHLILYCTVNTFQSTLGHISFKPSLITFFWFCFTNEMKSGWFGKHVVYSPLEGECFVNATQWASSIEYILRLRYLPSPPLCICKPSTKPIFLFTLTCWMSLQWLAYWKFFAFLTVWQIKADFSVFLSCSCAAYSEPNKNSSEMRTAWTAYCPI